MNTTEKELKNFNFPEMLIDLHRKRKTGTLTVDTGEIVKKVYIEKGKAVFASSTDEDDRLGETLIKLGKITIDQYERSVELLKETGKRQGTILVELGYLTPKDLVLGVKSQVREIIYSLFDIEFAEYEFDDGELPKREVITLQMGMGDLIYEGMKRIDNVVRIKREIPNMNAVLRLRDDNENILQDIALNHKDQALLSLIDGKRTVKELVDTAPNGTFEAMKILYVLCITGIVEEHQNIESTVDPVTDHSETIRSSKTEEVTFEERVNDLFSNLYKYGAHDLLGISESSDTKTVQSNYYQLVREFHPDRNISSTDPLMLDKLIAISEAIQNAYVLLREDDKRKDYFQSIKNPSREEIKNKYEEEHFRAELSKVNDEILSSRDESDQEGGEAGKDGELLNGILMNHPPIFSDSPCGEPYQEYVPNDGEEEPSTFDAEENSVIEEGRIGDSYFIEKTDRPSDLLDYLVEEKVAIPADQEAYETTFSHDASVGEETISYQDETTLHEQSSEVQDTGTEQNETGHDESTHDLKAESEAAIHQRKEVEKRRHERFRVDSCEVSGEMSFASEVTIVDISMSGVALRIDRHISVGREYFLNLRDKDKVINIKVEVVRSELISSRTDANGEIIPQYAAGMAFKHISQNVKEKLAEFINNYKIDEDGANTSFRLSGTRLYGRFHIGPHAENMLDLKICYQVKVLSLSGMLIESDHAISENDTAQMNISLSEDDMVSALGRIVSCREINTDPERYDVAIEFIEISEGDREKLKRFLQVVSDSQESVADPDKTAELNETAPEEFHTNVNESCVPSSHLIMERDSEKPREICSQETVNNQLLELIGEIKSLLTQLRSAIPAGVAHTVSTADKATEPKEPEKPLSESSYEPEQVRDDVREHAFEVSQEEYEAIPTEVKGYLDEPKQETREEEIKAEPWKVQPAKRNLNLWHIVIPVLFLLAATASFLFIYTPEKQKAVSQAVQAKKEMLPAVKPTQLKEVGTPVSQKTSEIQPLPTPEAKTTAGAGAVQTVQHTIELIATESTWLSATIDEKSSKEMILKAGDKVKWTAKKNVSLIIGNAAGLKIIFDGKEMSPLGAQGKVVRLRLPSAGNS